MERLQKYLARTGIGSRRKCEELITSGAVKVNGKTVTVLGTSVDPATDTVTINDRVLAPEDHVYLALYKPLGYVTTLRDPQRRRTVKELVKGVAQRVYPIGRLDYNTEGLLLMTNDGELAHALTHPRFHVPKTYVAVVDGTPGPATLARLGRGVRLTDGVTAPAKVRLLRSGPEHSIIELTIREGRNRQVRRMCEAVGHPVKALRRTAFGSIPLGNMKPGQIRPLTAREVHSLKALCRLSH